MGFGKAEISAQSAHLPHPNIGDIALHLAEGRQLLSEERIVLEAAVCGQRADAYHSILKLDSIQAGDFLDVDEPLVLDQALFHGQEEFGATGIDSRGLSVAGQQCGSILDSFGFL